MVTWGKGKFPQRPERDYSGKRKALEGLNRGKHPLGGKWQSVWGEFDP